MLNTPFPPGELDVLSVVEDLDEARRVRLHERHPSASARGRSDELRISPLLSRAYSQPSLTAEATDPDRRASLALEVWQVEDTLWRVFTHYCVTSPGGDVARLPAHRVCGILCSTVRRWGLTALLVDHAVPVPAALATVPVRAS